MGRKDYKKNHLTRKYPITEAVLKNPRIFIKNFQLKSDFCILDTNDQSQK